MWYEQLLESDDGPQVEELLPISQVRPVPPESAGWQAAHGSTQATAHLAWAQALGRGLSVEVFVDDAWWSAVFVGHDGEDTSGPLFLVQYLQFDGQAQLPAYALRPSWKFDGTSEIWSLDTEVYDV